jgi:hypothetical protein
MTLAALDGDALYQIVILALLGGGSLVKKFFEAQQARRVVQDAKGPDAFERANRRKREQTMDRLADVEEEMDDDIQDPWVAQESEGADVGAPEKVYRELDPAPLPTRGRVDAAAATLEVSIEGGALEDFSTVVETADRGSSSGGRWEPGGRIRESVFADIEQSVAHDIIEHVDADMAGGVRGEARAGKVRIQKVPRARYGWRDAVIAAEVLASPVSLRDSASQPAGLRSE